MKAVIVAGGAHAPADRRRLDDADLVLAANGGADWLVSVGVRPAAVIGDLDSASSDVLGRLQEGPVRIERHPVDKDASDLELGVAAALAAGADELVLLGALGGRLDHLLANVLLLGSSAVRSARMCLVHGGTTARQLEGPQRIVLGGPAGAIVSLLAVGGPAEGVTTEGLRWPLRGEALAPGSSRGLSNVIDEAPAAVEVESGRLLVVEVMD